MLNRLRLWWLRFWGELANLAGFPGFVRAGEYSSDQLKVQVKVRTSPLFTVVTVNGIDVFFYRLTGGIDGVGFAIRTSDCTPGEAPRSAGSVAPPVALPEPLQ